MNELPNVTVCGCGSGAMAMAADIAMLGCKVTLYELPDFKDNLEPIHENGGIFLTGNTHSGKTGLARLYKVTDDAENAVQDSELIMINVPASAVDKFVVALSPYLNQDHTILVTTGYWASLRLRKLLEKNDNSRKATIVEQNIMPYLSRKIGPAQAHIYNYKKDLRISAWPARENKDAHKLIASVYPQIKLSKNILENNLQPGNPCVHAQINIPKADFFFDRAKEFRFYGEVSMCASKLMDAFDLERMRVAAALDCKTITLVDWINKTYGYEGQNMYEMCGSVTNPHTHRWGNDAGNRRVLIEDLCYFFVPMEQLAEVVRVKVPVTKAILEIIQIFTDYDYRANGLTLRDLGMEGFDKKQIIDFVTNGEQGD